MQKETSGKTVRIWTDRKKRLADVIIEKSKKERRPISEAEMVSKAVDMLCEVEERELGLKNCTA